ncbi:MAG: hypothetical protein UR85_C0004G0035 [Candidatus Nomurabacteria bacterium GW2011_GWF2_35_66]|uniref:Uncharacterized protein n=1 Tax=Candidatus Nomurabacteria bacterium GW2011_GWE1_35_16 TaxID=1618761 RepID=A0A0G0DUV7_9BACT|nr:MAG: hypothetical protein UR55_C0002G0034 [Candidatus Nomurabacteria bacterium GW2011_GWF1_34_20]KKP63613.1 MAG: hypothetical protein UR57_C0002G0034 [Candidatus Nomurabacteria bacterium GW2011_GWE2_34_25]KKP66815.1 MAG: hypothetical protein UR64_C0002G0031 [Candidatus Nomurabacteria bacterium GW2011_GWE1_35_16]KKP83441.1 MAG: hypothetical protein UR85_C0004G0035 [Candidatus Nomurabacteria bacterium GW2011_GWF2_35_66]HAE36627.1 hypothetical protein [Candidatus Nomurabacteria bacterium]
MKIKFFTNLIKRHNKNTTLNLVSGFTIIEALVAVFILSVSVASMLGVTATSASHARYVNNEITANYLLQEAIDSIRNSRDTIAFQMKDDLVNGGWNNFLKRYGYDISNGAKTKCFSDKGCYLEIDKFEAKNLSSPDISECDTAGCKSLSYDPTLTSSLFYYYSTDNTNLSFFNRKIIMVINPTNPDEVKVTAKVEWRNVDYTSNTKTQELSISLLNWQN